MPILKAQTYRSASKDAVVLDLGDLGKQAAKLKALAEQKAQQILDDARQQAEQLTRDATQVGEQRGHDQGLEAGRLKGLELGKAQALEQHAAELQALHQQWTHALAQYEQRAIRLEAQAKSTALQLAVKLAEKITHQAIRADDQHVLRQVAAALHHVLEPARVRIHLHPDDRPILEQALPDLIKSLDNITHAQAVDDPDVKRGGCVVHAGPATIDAQIDTQLQRLAELLIDAPADAAEQARPADDSTHPQQDTPPSID